MNEPKLGERELDIMQALWEGDGGTVADVHQALGAMGELLHTITSAVRPEIVLFAVVGLVIARGRPGLRGQFLLAVVAVYWVADWALAYSYGYLSRRHTLAPALLLLGYAASAVPAMGQALLRLVRRPASPGALRVASALALLLLVGLALGKVLRPQRASNAAEREAAGDPRPSIDERYASKEDYLARVRAAAEALVRDRHLLAEDVGGVVEVAARKWDAFRGR